MSEALALASAAVDGPSGPPDPTRPVGGGDAPLLTADLCARAIIAAARAFGDDPVMACTSQSARKRRALSAAASGLVQGADVGVLRAQAVLGLSHCAIRQARRAQGEPWAGAALAAMRAVEFALWQAEAVEDEDEAVAVAEEIQKPLAEATDDAPRPPPPAPPPPPPPPPPPEPVAPPWGTRLAGAIGASLQMGRPPMAPPGVTSGDRALRDLVVEALASGPKDSMNLASCVDRKEMAVIVELNALQRAGEVMSEDIADGARRFRWHLTDKGRGA